MAKKKVKKTSTAPNPLGSTSEAKTVPESPNSLSQNTFMNVCRLCEAKDGPFINIFHVEQTIHKKIEILLPFSVTESDDLPHRICFRCSAKVEDLFEFVQKCIRTQNNLYKAIGKDSQAIPDTRDPKKLWEKKLVQSNMSNEDVCNAVIKKAMEGIADLPLSPEPCPLTDIEPRPLTNVAPVTPQIKRKTRNLVDNLYHEDVKSPQTYTHVKQYSNNASKKTTRTKQATPAKTSEVSKLDEELDKTPAEINKPSVEPKKDTEISFDKNSFSFDTDDLPQTDVKTKTNSLKRKISKESICKQTDESNDVIKIPSDDEKVEKPQIVKPQPKQVTPEKKDPNFNIMDHVSMIKVNGVGVLFQCKLCNRNFLKKDVLQNHGCAKTGIAKPDLAPSKPADPPKNPMASVKYITNKPVEPKTDVQVLTEKPKPRIGPASKIKKISQEDMIALKINSTPVQTQVSSNQSNQFLPGKNLFRLLPGPNNSFTLVQDTDTVRPAPKTAEPPPPDMIHGSDSEPEIVPTIKPGPKSKVRKFTRPVQQPTPSVQTQPSQPYPVGLFAVNSNNPEEIITPIQQPPMNFTPQYTNPVPTQVYTSQIPQQHYANQMPQQFYGNQMQQQHYPNQIPQQYGNQMPQHYGHQMSPQQDFNNMISPQQNFNNMISPLQNSGNQMPAQYQNVSEPPITFTTPAMKKQSYTVVQTGHPSKLLISTKPQPKLTYKILKKSTAVTDDYNKSSSNIIQESQISTSSSRNSGTPSKNDYPYKCHMCPVSFSREKKLLTHLQGHYSKLPDINTGETPKKNRKS